MKRAWLVRAGRLGERKTLDLKDGLAVIGWLELPDLSKQDSRESLMQLLQHTYPDASPKRLLNWQAQIWAFLHTIPDGDLVALPLKTTSAVAIGEVVGGYHYNTELPADARHTRLVKWLKPDLPRTAFSQDLLYSLGAFLTVCEIKRHEAVRRLENLARTGQDPGWTGKMSAPTTTSPMWRKRQAMRPPARSTSSATQQTRSAPGSPSGSLATASPGS